MNINLGAGKHRREGWDRIGLGGCPIKIDFEKKFKLPYENNFIVE